MIKFENQRAFEKHLHSLRSVETVFVVLAQDDKERQDLAFKIKSVVLEKAPHFGVSCFTCIRDSIATILEAYQSMSLFANHQIIEICDIHLLPDRDFTLLKNQIQKSCHDTVTLLLGKKNIPSLKGMSNEVILLDLLNEKPWDHKKRVAQLLVEYIKKTDKNIEPQALDQLIEFIGIDYAALLQQVESLICLTGERKMIGLDDLKSLTVMRKKQKTWQLAEYVTWGEGGSVPQDELTDSEFLSLLIQVRFRLSMAIKLKEGIHPGELSPSLIQKYLSYSERLHKGYFQKAFVIVYDIERLSRIGQFSISFLFDMLYVKLHDLREVYTCQTVQVPNPA